MRVSLLSFLFFVSLSHAGTRTCNVSVHFKESPYMRLRNVYFADYYLDGCRTDKSKVYFSQQLQPNNAQALLEKEFKNYGFDFVKSHNEDLYSKNKKRTFVFKIQN